MERDRKIETEGSRERKKESVCEEVRVRERKRDKFS